MSNCNKIHFSIPALIAVYCLGLVNTGQAGDSKIFCYYGSTSQYRTGGGKFLPEDIDPFLCTHIIFAFADVTDGQRLSPSNWNDAGDRGLYARTMALKQTNPQLKVIVSVGGWVVGSSPFQPVIQSEQSMADFALNVVAFLRQHGFDGIDIDWEFPGTRGSPPSDKHKFTILLKTLQQVFTAEAQQTGSDKLVLVAAAAGGSYYINMAYEPREIVKHLDFILLMSYNYHGGWNKFTGHHSPLFPRQQETGGEREWNQAWTIEFWLKTGVAKEKIIVGISAYGMSFTLADQRDNGLHAKASGSGLPGKYTKEAGILAYYEVCDNLLNNGWTAVWNDDHKVPYAYKGDQWVGYDDIDSVSMKARFISYVGLGGAFIWSVETDDFAGTCGQGKYPLLNAIASTLRTTGSASASVQLPHQLADDGAAVNDIDNAIAAGERDNNLQADNVIPQIPFQQQQQEMGSLSPHPLASISDSVPPLVAVAPVAVHSPRELGQGRVQGQVHQSQGHLPPVLSDHGNDESQLLAPPEPTQNAIDVNVLRNGAASGVVNTGITGRQRSRSLSGQLPSKMTSAGRQMQRRLPTRTPARRPALGLGFGTPEERSLDGGLSATADVNLDDRTLVLASQPAAAAPSAAAGRRRVVPPSIFPQHSAAAPSSPILAPTRSSSRVLSTGRKATPPSAYNPPTNFHQQNTLSVISPRPLLTRSPPPPLRQQKSMTTMDAARRSGAKAPVVIIEGTEDDLTGLSVQVEPPAHARSTTRRRPAASRNYIAPSSNNLDLDIGSPSQPHLEGASCEKPGIYPDVTSPQGYIVCVIHGDRLHTFRMRCPSGSVFDTVSISCSTEK